MNQPKFVIEPSEAESIAKSLGLPSVLHLLPALVRPAQTLARPPISGFHVGAVGLGSDGRVFLGVNLEFPGLPLHHSVHAEQFLVTNLAVHGCSSLLSLAVSAAPCGHCRQFLQELRNSSSIQIFITNEEKPNNDLKFKPISAILPNPFGPFDLLDDETPLLLESHKNGLCFSGLKHVNRVGIEDGNISNGFCQLSLVNGDTQKKQTDFDVKSGNLSNGFDGKYEDRDTLLRSKALEAANNSHAPYSGCPSGVALMDRDGKVYKGSYVESAAYNPSLGPVQAALVAYVAGGGGGYEKIVAAALVEKEGAKVRQEDTARLLLKVVSPKCEFKVFHCISAGK